MPHNTVHKLKYVTEWKPIPNTAQVAALGTKAAHILLTGGRGWGKTELQLMRFLRRVGLGYGTYWRGIIFDHEYKNLDDLVIKSKRLFRKFPWMRPRWMSSKSDFKWVWPTGEELLFRAASTEEDYNNYHGHEYPFIGWNELTKYPNSKLFDRMMSVNRSGFDPAEHTPRKEMMGHNGGPPLNDNWQYSTPDREPLPPIPLEVVSTTNPYGAGHNWVKRRYIDPAPYGRVVTTEVEIYSPTTKKQEIVKRTQIALFGSFRENPYLDDQYIATLHAETDANILKAWLKGDWDIVAGGAFDDVWQKRLHVVPKFKVPENWYVDRALDWGSTSPFAVGWFAESNGEEVTLDDGRKVYFTPGTLIQIWEYYGTKEIGSNVGLKMGADEVARNIKVQEAEMRAAGVLSLKHPVNLGPADNQINGTALNPTDDTVAKRMGDEGVYWHESDKSPGSRKQGLELMRMRLKNLVQGKDDGLCFMQHCRASIQTIPVLPRSETDPDDVPKTGLEDHAYDMTRYRTLKGGNRVANVLTLNRPSNR